MKEQFSRTAKVLGENSIDKLANLRVAVFGIGGVGGHAVEALARAGVGAIDLIDNDIVSVSNINRQAVALHSTVGRPKVEVMRDKILDINPHCSVTIHQCFYLPETADRFDFTKFDYILDCVDTVAAKIDIICRAKELETPVISAMGAGNKLDPTAFKVADIYDTKVCPLARIMRTNLKKRGIESLKVVYSEEIPIESIEKDPETGRSIPGSVPFVPSVMGLIMAGETIKDLIKK